MASHLEMVSILVIFTGKHTDFCFVSQQVLCKVVVWSSNLRCLKIIIINTGKCCNVQNHQKIS